jgi:hypothetical protein
MDVCPVEEPMVGSPCDFEGAQCTFVPPCCEPVLYVCLNAEWTTPLPPVCNHGCPVTPPVEGDDCSCVTDVVECKYEDPCIYAACDGIWYIRGCIE